MQPPNVIAEPRSFLGTAIMFGVVTGPAYGLLMGLFAMLVMKEQASLALPLWAGGGILFGVTFGLGMAARFHGESASVPAESEAALLLRLDVATAEISYFPALRAAGYYIYKPSFQAGLLAGRISVAVGDGRATIVGPKIYVRRLLKRLPHGVPVAA